MNLSKGFNMIGTQFLQVGGEPLAIATVGVLDSSMAGFDEDGVYATEMQIWNGNGYDYYGWSGTSAGEYMEDESLNNMWLNGDFKTDDATSTAGQGFWIKAATAGTITLSGEVPSADSVSQDLVVGFNLVANPYPGDVQIANFGQLAASFAGFDEDGVYATEMQVWNGNGYDYYGWSGTSAGEYMEDESLNNMWLDGDFKNPNKTIPFGHGVWIKTPTAGKITFTSPVAE